MTKEDNPSRKENRNVQHFRRWSTWTSFFAWAIVLIRPRQPYSSYLVQEVSLSGVDPETMRTCSFCMRIVNQPWWAASNVSYFGHCFSIRQKNYRSKLRETVRICKRHFATCWFTSLPSFLYFSTTQNDWQSRV